MWPSLLLRGATERGQMPPSRLAAHQEQSTLSANLF
jgi:hypothetical protein